MCCVCRQRKEKNELIRLCLDETGQAHVDENGKGGGRGVYVCHDEACMQKALKTGAIERGLRAGRKEI